MTPWTVACQTPVCGISQERYWSGLPFPPLGHLPKIKVLTEFDPFEDCEGRMWCCLLSGLVDGHLLPVFVPVETTGLAKWQVYVVRPYNGSTWGKVNVWQACPKFYNVTIRKSGSNLFLISTYRNALCLWRSIFNVLLSHLWPQMFSAELWGTLSLLLFLFQMPKSWRPSEDCFYQ